MDSSSPQTGYVYDESTDGNDLLDDGLRLNETTYPVAANAKNSWVYGAGSISDRLHRASLQTLVGGNFKSSTHAIEYKRETNEKRGQVQLLTIRLDLVRSEDAQNSSQRPRWIGLPRD